MNIPIEGRRGSGYQVTEALVLTTAAYVVQDATSVRVRFDADTAGESRPAQANERA